MKKSFVGVSVAAVCLLMALKVHGAEVAYVASLNTLPQAQGFQYVDNPEGAPPPTIAGALLLQGPTTNFGQQFWLSPVVGRIVFDEDFYMEATLRVDSSTYDVPTEGGIHRAGYHLLATDEIGRRLFLSIASTGVFLNTDQEGELTNGIPFTAMSIAGGFHTFRVSTQGGHALLSVDGAAVGQTLFGPSGIATPNLIAFGDISNLGSSQTALARFAYASAVPEPSSWVLMALALPVLAMRRRYR